MGRLRRTLCPTCQIETKLPARGYCAGCLKAYQKTYNALWKERNKRKLKPNPEPAMPDPKEELMAEWDLEPYARKHLGLSDNANPSTADLAAYCGWGIDRHSKRSYGANGFVSSNDWDQAYLIGHMAVTKFWKGMNGTAWEMGPDSEILVDGQPTHMSYRKGHRWTNRIRHAMEPFR